MAVRELIRIDEALCDGCGECVPACAEGAIAVVDGKARLVSDVYCDGMGACLGHCPQGAITIEKVEANPFDESAVAVHLAAARPAAPARPEPAAAAPAAHHAGGACPGSRTLDFRPQAQAGAEPGPPSSPSALRQWPVQLHLLSPAAPYFRGADVLLAADCVAFAVGDFHRRHLAGRSLAIACPKLDVQQEVYRDKLTAFIDQSGIASLTVMIMQVPCCGGLVQLALQAAARASRTVPMRYVVVGVQGDTLDEGALTFPGRARAAASLPVRQ
jgi:Pyruvate/2-oxoacid:ferredoxin oxidoreductase delta subunit